MNDESSLFKPDIAWAIRNTNKCKVFIAILDDSNNLLGTRQVNVQELTEFLLIDKDASKHRKRRKYHREYGRTRS